MQGGLRVVRVSRVIALARPTRSETRDVEESGGRDGESNGEEWLCLVGYAAFRR